MAIEHRIEAPAILSNYSVRQFSEQEIAAGGHRRFVGGRWETHGKHQFDYMTGRGLLPEHTLLDIGCGCFRAGRYFIEYLKPGNYYGVDANLSLMQAGYDVELTDDQRSRLPVENLRANDRFDVDFGVQFDFALAQSVFTHVSLNHIRLCMYRAANVVRPGGSFYATFFERPTGTPVDYIGSANKPQPSYTEKDIFWYYRNDLAWAARIAPWRLNYIGDWGHPVNQMMVQFIRLTDEEIAERAARKAARVRAGQRTVSQGRSSLVRRGRRWAARRLDPDR